MGCQLTKTKKNIKAFDSRVINQSSTTQSTSIYYTEKLQRQKKKSIWISQNIPQLMLEKSDLYRRRMQHTY